MKNTMKKITATFLALTCLPMTGMTASAEELPAQWSGNTIYSASVLEQTEPVNHRGNLSDGIQLYVGKTIRDPVYFVIPQMKTIRFVLRDDVDPDTGTAQAAEILDTYFPGIKDCLDTNSYHSRRCRYYSNKLGQAGELGLPDLVRFGQVGTNPDSRLIQLTIGSGLDNSRKLEADYLIQLAQHHLISEFYGWGETAECQEGYLGSEILENLQEGDTDWDSVQAYLTQHYPGYSVESYEKTDQRSDQPDASVQKGTINRYRILGAEDKSLKEQFELFAELYEHFQLSGLDLMPVGYESGEQLIATGHNALERPFDANLDCTVDIMDVIAANKHLLGVAQLDKNGVKNADTNGDGTVDSTDTLAILKNVLDMNA